MFPSTRLLIFTSPVSYQHVTQSENRNSSELVQINEFPQSNYFSFYLSWAWCRLKHKRPLCIKLTLKSDHARHRQTAKAKVLVSNQKQRKLDRYTASEKDLSNNKLCSCKTVSLDVFQTTDQPVILVNNKNVIPTSQQEDKPEEYSTQEGDNSKSKTKNIP